MTTLQPLVSLQAKRILVVEDEFLICEELITAFAKQGAEIVGPAPSVAAAIEIIETEADIDAAVLDISLQGILSFPVAQLLRQRGIPFVFATGYDADVIPQEYAGTIRCEKPVDPEAVAQALSRDMNARGAASHVPPNDRPTR